jgi:hypothetical protein
MARARRLTNPTPRLASSRKRISAAWSSARHRSYCDRRELLRSLADYPDLQDITVWQVSAATSPKNAQPAR